MRKNLKFLVSVVATTAAWMLVAVPAAQATHECTNVLVPAQLISPATRVLVSPAQPRTLISPAQRVAPVYRTETRTDSYVGDACCKYTHTNRWKGGRTYTCVSYSGPVTDCGEHGSGFLSHSSSGGLTYPKTYTYSYDVSVLVTAGYTIPAVYSEAVAAVYRDVPAVYSEPRYECRPIQHSSGGGSSVTTYTLSYDANGGSAAPGSASWTSDLTPPTVASGASMNAPSGKVFSFWNTRSDGSGNTYSPGSRAPAATTLLYAVWVNAAAAQFTVTYNANGGTGAPASRSVTSGGSFTVASGSSMTPPTGKTFTGWRTAGGTPYIAGSSYTVNADLTLIAQWGTASGPVRPS